jgi:hypothetical protein
MKTKTKLQVTRDYGRFELHEKNRDLHGDKKLAASMERRGFLPGCAIYVRSNGNGKFTIMQGHNRFIEAKRLGLPVWYIIDDSTVDIYDLEASTRGTWSGRDWAVAHSNNDNDNYRRLLAFTERYRLSLGVAAALCSDRHKGGGVTDLIKSGKFAFADSHHARAVGRLVDFCRESGVPFATSSAFVAALSMTLRVPGLDVEQLKARVAQYPNRINHCSRREEYLPEIEALYNYRTRGARLNIAFLALEVAANRPTEKARA